VDAAVIIVERVPVGVVDREPRRVGRVPADQQNKVRLVEHVRKHGDVALLQRGDDFLGGIDRQTQ